jgi:hypothetical protein
VSSIIFAIQIVVGFVREFSVNGKTFDEGVEYIFGINRFGKIYPAGRQFESKLNAFDMKTISQEN